MQFDKFNINLEGLKLGKHEFKFLVDTTFFKDLDYSEIEQGNVVVNMELDRSERLFQIELLFKGNVTIPCDRCGDDLDVSLDFDESLVVKFGDEPLEDDGLIVLGKKTSEFDISHYLYETIFISLPARKVHNGDQGECNPKALEYLSKEKKSDNDDIDPRWSELLKLK